MMDAAQFVQAAATHLSSVLGGYDWGNGEVTPAIALLPHRKYGMQYPPAGVTVSGVELVVYKPELEGLTPTLDGYTQVERIRVVLKQWNAGETLLPIVPVLLAALPHYLFSEPIAVPANESSGILETLTFQVATIYGITCS